MLIKIIRSVEIFGTIKSKSLLIRMRMPRKRMLRPSYLLAYGEVAPLGCSNPTLDRIPKRFDRVRLMHQRISRRRCHVHLHPKHR